MQKHNDNLCLSTDQVPHLFSKLSRYSPIMCPPSYKLINDLSKTMGLHFMIHYVRKYAN